jgi:hypothetical protein
MTYTRHRTLGPVAVWGAAFFTLVAMATAAWVTSPSLGLKLGIGYPLLTAGMIWWRWLFPPNLSRLWMLTGFCMLLVLALAGAGYEAAGLRGLEPAGRIAHAVLASLFFMPALIVATTDKAHTTEDDDAPEAT